MTFSPLEGDLLKALDHFLLHRKGTSDSVTILFFFLHCKGFLWAIFLFLLVFFIPVILYKTCSKSTSRILESRFSVPKEVSQ